MLVQEILLVPQNLILPFFQLMQMKTASAFEWRIRAKSKKTGQTYKCKAPAEPGTCINQAMGDLDYRTCPTHAALFSGLIPHRIATLCNRNETVCAVE